MTEFAIDLAGSPGTLKGWKSGVYRKSGVCRIPGRCWIPGWCKVSCRRWDYIVPLSRCLCCCLRSGTEVFGVKLGEGWSTRLGRECAGVQLVIEEGKDRGINCLGMLMIEESLMIQEFLLKVF